MKQTARKVSDRLVKYNIIYKSQNSVSMVVLDCTDDKIAKNNYFTHLSS